MKARMRFWNGQWWCRRMGVTGCGPTMEAAWADMWQLYREAVRPDPAYAFARAPRA